MTTPMHPRNAARKKAKPTRKELERIALAALVRCGAAAVAHSKVDAAYQRWLRDPSAPNNGATAAKVTLALDEVSAAGAALAKALRALRGAK